MTHGTGRWFTRRALLIGAALLATGACNTDAGQSEPADGIFVGRSGDIMIAVVAADDLVTVYACDGRAEGVSLPTWFHGQVEGGAGTLTADDGATIDLTVTADTFDAELRDLDGASTSFTGAAVTADDAGLYWGKQGDWLGGWILDDAGDQRGAVFKRNTGDASFVGIQPAQTQVILPDQTTMPIARMAVPKNYK